MLKISTKSVPRFPCWLFLPRGDLSMSGHRWQNYSWHLQAPEKLQIKWERAKSWSLLCALVITGHLQGQWPAWLGSVMLEKLGSSAAVGDFELLPHDSYSRGAISFLPQSSSVAAVPLWEARTQGIMPSYCLYYFLLSRSISSKIILSVLFINLKVLLRISLRPFLVRLFTCLFGWAFFVCLFFVSFWV